MPSYLTQQVPLKDTGVNLSFRAQPTMKIALLDPGLKSMKGHHFDLDLRLLRGLERRGHEVSVHGWAGLPSSVCDMARASGMPLQPSFRAQTYERLPEDADPWTSYSQIVKRTIEDISTLPDADLWFWPTFSPFQFAAAVGCGRKVRQIGGMWWLPRFPHPVGARAWRTAVHELGNAAAPISVGAYDERLACLCGTFSAPLPVLTMPCPHDGAAPSGRPPSLGRIGFLGHQRPARGISLLPKLISAVLDRGYDVLVHDSGGVVRQLQSDPRLEVLHYVEDFAAVIGRCDLVVWPSYHEAYVHQYSGIVAESIASGIPVVAPAGCLPAEILLRYGCGRFFNEPELAAVIEAIDHAARDFPALGECARLAGQTWHRTQGTAHLVEWLENECGGGK